MNKKIGMLVFVALLTFGIGRADAAVIFFPNAAAGFALQMAGDGAVPFGTVETFEESILGPAAIAGLDDPLTIVVPNGPFPAGLTGGPLTVQSNLSGAAPVVPNPRGFNGLAAVSAGILGAVSDVVVANFFVDSHDVIFNPLDSIRGVSFNAISVNGAGPIDVRVYNQANVLLGIGSIPGTPDGVDFMGVAATGADFIGRINLFSTVNASEGADDIAMFAAAANPNVVPEPSSLIIFAGLATIAGFRGWRGRKRTSPPARG